VADYRLTTPISILKKSSGRRRMLQCKTWRCWHNKVLTREYQLALPEEKRLVEEMEKTQRMLTGRMTRPTDG